VSKLQMAALSRADSKEADRKDFYLYVDEFQNFITDAFSSILSEARKYRLNLVVAHQYLGQLQQEAGSQGARSDADGKTLAIRSTLPG
jgi:type IV secretory pathway TraG/TraD family ATPase VirD4